MLNTIAGCVITTAAKSLEHDETPLAWLKQAASHYNSIKKTIYQGLQPAAAYLLPRMKVISQVL